MVDLLVLDDDNAFLQLVEDFFTPEGISVRGFTHAVSTLASLRACYPSALILDLMLPEYDGITFYHHLRADPATTYLPIIISTAADYLLPTANIDDDPWCIALAKPYTLSTLQSSLDQLLAAQVISVTSYR